MRSATRMPDCTLVALTFLRYLMRRYVPHAAPMARAILTHQARPPFCSSHSHILQRSCALEHVPQHPCGLDRFAFLFVVEGSFFAALDGEHLHDFKHGLGTQLLAYLWFADEFRDAASIHSRHVALADGHDFVAQLLGARALADHGQSRRGVP